MSRRKRPDWNAAAFEYHYQRLNAEQKQRAWNDLAQEQQKMYREWKVLTEFAAVSDFNIDPRYIYNCIPPEPDCMAVGCYVELGEVTDENLARNAGVAAKQKQDIFGGALSQMRPLARIFLAKCRKNYTTNGRPVHLLLYYCVGHQFPDSHRVSQEILAHKQAVLKRLRKSSFASVSLYDGWERRVLAYIER